MPPASYGSLSQTLTPMDSYGLMGTQLVCRQLHLGPCLKLRFQWTPMDSNGLHSTPKVSLTNQISWQLLARFGTALLVVSATAGPSLGRHGTAPPSPVGLQHIHPKPPCYDKQVCVVLLCYMFYHLLKRLYTCCNCSALPLELVWC